MDPQDAHPLESRTPTKQDLLLICRSLNSHGARYVLVGGFAVMQQGYIRTTEDIDLLVDDSPENEALVLKALEILPDKAAREVQPGELKKYVVIRIADEVTVDLMARACGISYNEAAPEIEMHRIDDVEIPVASAKLLLRMKQTHREKDAADRLFLQQKLAGRI